jgi:hypothetical protein
VRTIKRISCVEIFLTTILAVVGCTIAAIPAAAQQGDNVVYGASATTHSSAFIDATAFCASAGHCTTSDDFCAVVNKAMATSSISASGGVIDARGINSAGNNTCANSPFVSPNTIATPFTILLPSGTISISKVWILPNGTKIIGQGSGVTTIATASGFSNTGTMIQMGPNSSSADKPLTPCASALATFCTEVSVEDLALVGPSSLTNSVSGIVNGQSEDMSYVRRVSMFRLGGIGLQVQNNAQNSGPYSDITYDTGGAGSSTTECVELDVSSRGVNGLSCKSETTTPSAAIVVNSSNNSIKDVKILGTFTDGIQVSTTASSDVLFNISGGTGVTYLVALESATASPQDISIMSVVQNGSTHTVLDNVTTTTLNDPFVAMYVLGLPGVGGDGHSRFTTSVTTSPNAVTWGVGATLPSTCAKGSLFSYTGTSANPPDLYVCTTSGTWTPVA